MRISLCKSVCVFLILVPLQLFCIINPPISLAGKIEFSVWPDNQGIYMVHYVDENTAYERTNMHGEMQEIFEDLNSDGVWTPAEIYADANLNGEWDQGEVFNDANLNGVYDPAEEFSDSNSNGVWDNWQDLEELPTISYLWDPMNAVISYSTNNTDYTYKNFFISKINDSIYTYVADNSYGIIYDENLDLDKNGIADKEQIIEMQNVEFFFGNRSSMDSGLIKFTYSLEDIMISPYLESYLHSVNSTTSEDGSVYQLNTYQSSDLNNWELIDTKSIQNTEESLFLKSELSID